jgi:hypothetical protein
MTARQGRLTLDDPTRPVPTRPTLFHTVGRETLFEVHDTAAEAWARAVALAGPDATLTLASQATAQAYPGFEIFHAVTLYRAEPGRGPEWFAAIACVARDELVALLESAGRERKAA